MICVDTEVTRDKKVPAKCAFKIDKLFDLAERQNSCIRKLIVDDSKKWVPKISNVDDAFFLFEESAIEEGAWFSQVIMHPVTAWESHWQEPPGSWYFLYCLFDYVYGNDDDDRAPLPSHTITHHLDDERGLETQVFFLLQTLAPGDDRNGQGSTHVVVICIFYFFSALTHD